MTERRMNRWAATGARVAVGAVLAGGAVVAVVAGVAAPWPTHSAQPIGVEATPAPSDTVLACDGPLLALGRVVEQAGDIEVAAAQALTAGPAGTAAAGSTLSAASGATPQTYTAAPADGARTAYAASGSSAVAADDLRGFAASACRPPLMESWLVGGATTTGSNDIVLLGNPGSVPATVQITVFGASGSSVPPGGVDRVVPAGAQIAIPLAGLIPTEESPVVRITATGAPVTASLQSSLIRVLLPGGVDQVSAVAEAATRQVVPGVSVTVAPGEAGASDPATIVRLLAPSADAEAVVTVYDSTGAAVGTPSTVPLTAGVPGGLELGELAVGRYTFVVESAEPVVAAVWGTTGFAAGSDFAWSAAAPEITTPSVLAVPTGPSPVLTLVNRGAEPTTVVLSSPGGADEEVPVPADGVVERTVAANTVYTLDPAAAVSAAVSFAGAGAMAGFPVWGSDADAQPVQVFP